MAFILGVIAGKGGVGKSILAANLSVAFAKDTKQKTLLIDADINSLGDQSYITGIRGTKNLYDLSKISVIPDLITFGKYFPASSFGTHLIACPTDMSGITAINPDELSKKIQSIAKFFPFIVIDLGHELNPLTASLLSITSACLMVTTQDVLVINQTRKLVAQFLENLYPQDAILCVLNKYDPNALISVEMITKNIGRPIIAGVANDPNTSDSCLNKSQLVINAQPNSSMSKGFYEIVRKINSPGVVDKLPLVTKPSVWKLANHLPQAGAPAGRTQLKAPNLKDSELIKWNIQKLEVLTEVAEKADFNMDTDDSMNPVKKAMLYDKTRKLIIDILQGRKIEETMPNQNDRARLVQEILDEALGLGPLEDLLADPEVKEIMVNGFDKIYIEKAGRVQLSKTIFSSEQQLMNAIKRIVLPLGRNIDKKTPFVDARLPDGSRVHAIIPPLALNGPTLTIRKFAKERLTYKSLIDYGSLTEPIAEFLRICIESKLNIVISGGTGSGKTTLLNILSNFIPSSERIITVEDAAELQLGQEHVVRLETKPKNAEGEGEVSIRDLVKQTLRMRPERIIVGECRDGAALDMLQAMNTGHDGSMTTVHSNSPRECISRLQTLCMMADTGMPLQAINEQIAQSVDLIIQQSRLEDGSRKITYITEVVGMQGDKITLQDIFYFKEEGYDKRRKITGRFIATGNIPKFLEKLEAKGIRIARGLFSNDAPAKPATPAAQPTPNQTQQNSSQKPVVPPKKVS